MILFQLEQFLLHKEIENYTYTIAETLSKFVIDTNYIDGDRRLKRNRTSKVVLSINGRVKSQHFLHYLRKISEKDEGRGDTKAYWIERYSRQNPDYKTFSEYGGKKSEDYEVRVYFGYVHIDITAINPFVDDYGDEHYDISFELSMFNTNVFEITNSVNAFIVNRYDNKNIYTYDDNVTVYDTPGTYYYDRFIDKLGNEKRNLPDQKGNLLDFYKKVTCCDDKSYLYIFFVDKIYKPFIKDNFFKDTGRINYSINNIEFLTKQRNFFQTYISNPKLSTTYLKREVIQYINYSKTVNPIADNEPFKISNIDNISNTYCITAIIQMFRMPVTLDSSTPTTKVTPTNNATLLPLFEQDGQQIQIKVSQGLEELSSIAIYCFDDDLRKMLKVLIIHPHNQKAYGILENVTMGINKNSHNYNTRNNNLIDLEQYLIEGKLTIVNELYNTQDWLKFSPAYAPRNELGTRRENDMLTFKTAFQDGTDKPIQASNGLFLQIESYTENKLI
jgi:hypothetical protein